MLRLTIIPLFLFFCITSYAQRFTLDELKQLCLRDNDFFDTYVLSKGYHFSFSAKNNLHYSYKDDKFFNEINLLYSKSQKDTSKMERVISWIFKSDTTYLAFKRELSINGYLSYYDYADSNEEGDAHHFFYSNREYDSSREYHIELVTLKPKIYKIPVYYVHFNK